MSATDELNPLAALREARLKTHTALAQLLPKTAIQACAQQLGLWREGAMRLQNQSEMYILLDYALYCYQEHGRSLQEQYLAQAGPQLSEPEKLFLEAGTRSRFRLLRVENIVPNLGLNGRDELDNATLFIQDQTLSHQVFIGSALVGRIVELPGFAMTTGAAIPLPNSALPILLYKIQTFFRNKPLKQLTQADNNKLQLLVLQLCLAAHSSADTTEDE